MGVVCILVQLYVVAIFVRIILSWFPIGLDSPFRPIVDFLYKITEPVLAPIRRVLPPMGGLDLSVLIVILAIRIILVPAADSIL